jgi:hypothetical protein
MQKDPTHMQGTPEWLKFNQQRLIKAANTLTRLMGGAGLFPAAQERLRKIFKYATNTGGMGAAIRVEKQLQAAETDKYHQDHAAEYLAAAGVKLQDLKTESVQ